MHQPLILLLSFALMFVCSVWGLPSPVGCCSCPSHPELLADLEGYNWAEWELDRSQGKCGPGKDICEVCLWSHYQELIATKGEYNHDGTLHLTGPVLHGASTILCGCCYFAALSSQRIGTMTVSAKDLEENTYDHCQFGVCCGFSEGSIEKKESWVCHVFGSGPIFISENAKRAVDWLCCFVQCGADEEEDLTESPLPTR